MKPNIIIVMTDQQRADLRKGAGYALDTMPFLDAWSCEGVDFAQAYTPNPTCMPARVSMFTGRFPECHKARTNHNAMDVIYTKDLLDIVKQNGYTTALCGKNHSHRKESDFDFCESSGHLGHEGNMPHDTPEQEAFAQFLDETRHMESHRPAVGGITVQHPYRNVSAALRFMDTRPKDQPFFMWVSFAEPHNPYQVPDPYFDLFPPELLPPLQTNAQDLPAKGERFTWLHGIWKEVLGEKDMPQRVLRARSNYHGMLRLIDDQFKRLMDGLADRGLSDDTIVVFLSDHGDFVGEYGLIRKGADLPDVLTHIPMVWRGPGIAPRARVREGCVSLVDILPTFCDILGMRTPVGCQGKSILPLLKGTQIPPREYDTAYAESGFSGLYWNEKDHLDLIAEGASQNMVTFDCLNTWTQCGQVRMVRKGDYKIQVDMMGTGYLYQLKVDPYERENLWDNLDYLQVKADMLTELAAAVLRACDPLPLPHQRYRLKVHPQGYWFQNFEAEDPGVTQLPTFSTLG